MADPFSFITDNFNFDPVDPEKEGAYLQGIAERTLAGEDGVQRARQEYERIAGYARAVGGEPPPENEPGLFSRFIDAIDTPRQWTQGMLGSVFGDDRFNGLGLLEAAKRGDELDISASDWTRDLPYLKEKGVGPSALRFLTGLVGDVVLDPTSYLGVGLVGKTVGMVPINGAKKIGKAMESGLEIASRLEKSGLDDLLETTATRLGVATKDLPKNLVRELELEAKYKASVPFQSLALLREDAKKKIAGRGFDQLSGVLGNELNEKASKIAMEMGLDLGEAKNVYEVLDTIVKKPAIRLSGPFSGSSSLGRIPLLGTEEADIPGITEASQYLFSKLSDGYYGLPVQIKNSITKGLAESPDSLFWRTADVVGSTLSGASAFSRKAAEKVSKRVQAIGSVFGSRVGKSVVNEHVRARGALERTSLQESEFLLQELEGFPDKDSIYNGIVSSNEEYGKAMSDLRMSKHKLTPEQLEQQSEVLWKQSLEKLRNRHNASTAGSGDMAVAAMEKMRVFFDSLGAKEVEAGILDKVLDGYIHRSYFAPGAVDLIDASDDVRNAARNLFKTKQGTDFTLKRVFESINEAKDLGYIPETNLKNIVATRLYAHKMAMADKEFAERLAYQLSLTPEARRKLNAMAVSDVAAYRSRALDILRRSDVAPDFREGAEQRGVLFTTSDNPLNPKLYEDWVSKINNPDGVPENELSLIKGEMRRLGLDTESADRVKESHKLYQELVPMLPGREGESQFARAGATTLEELTGRNLRRKKDEFWDGLLPQGFAEAYKESIHNRSLLSSMANKLRLQDKDPASDAVFRMVKTFDTHRRWSQKWLTLPWPAYWARNMVSGMLQPLESVSTLGEALNPFRMLQYRKLFKDPTFSMMTANGERLTAETLYSELARAGFSTSQTMTEDFLSSYVDHYLASGELLGRKLPQLGMAMKEKERLAKLSRVGKAKDAALKFGQRMESFGRTFTYLNLRLKGHDPMSAAENAHRLLVDYQMGKTQFERDFMTPTFFFYAFSRGNLTNQVTAMFRKPGALSNKISFGRNTKEFLIDPNNYDKDEFDEETMSSLRTSLGLNEYVGMNPETGLPRVMQGSGTDFEETARYFQVLDPFTKARNFSSWGEIVNSFGDATSEAMKVAVSQLNPVAKGILENLVFKRNVYFDRPITDETLRKIPKFERDMPKVLHNITGAFAIPNVVWDALDGTTKAVLGGKENKDGTYTVNPYTLAALTALVPAASRFYATRAQLTAPGGRGSDKITRFISGIHASDVDPDKSVAYSNLDKIRKWSETRDYPVTKRELADDLSIMDDEEE